MHILRCMLQLQFHDEVFYTDLALLMNYLFGAMFYALNKCQNDF